MIKLDKKILESQDIVSISPNLAILSMISRQEAGDIGMVLIDIDKKTLLAITTNDKPDLVNTKISKLIQEGYKLDMYYTDSESFASCMIWYDQKDKQDGDIKDEKIYEMNATGPEAEKLILQFFENRNNMDDGIFISEIIRLGFQAGASDLHFQPGQSGVDMRIRIDGIMHNIIRFTNKEFRKYIAKIKFISGMKINIDYVPQDGRFDFKVNINTKIKKIDVRVGCMPGMRGESIVMRFLDGAKSIYSLEEIGFRPDQIQTIQDNLSVNYGMILVTGPTGSGKTTTLYSMLNMLNKESRKIITLEDPVEYEIQGIQQSQINERKGYDYIKGLKAILRQDPNVILVGEIRSLESAEIAINAALTGHLVLSSLHTNTAVEAISRLINLGVKPYLIASSINMIIGQRLARKLTDKKIIGDILPEDKLELELNIDKIKSIRSDMKINYDGRLYYPSSEHDYAGRTVLAEIMVMNDDIRSMILGHKSTVDIYQYMRSHGFLSMKKDGYLKVLQGLTTCSEVRRVI